MKRISLEETNNLAAHNVVENMDYSENIFERLPDLDDSIEPSGVMDISVPCINPVHGKLSYSK